jgi:hypothetical protein
MELNELALIASGEEPPAPDRRSDGGADPEEQGSREGFPVRRIRSEPQGDRGRWIAEWAATHSLSYSYEDPAEISSLPIHWLWEAPVSDVVRGAWHGVKVTMFDCVPVGPPGIEGGIAKGVPTTCAASTLDVTCPRLLIRPAIGWERWVPPLGFMRHRSGTKGFDRRFWFEARDKPFARRLLTTETARWLLEPGEGRPHSVDVSGRCLLVHAPELATTTAFERLLNTLVRMADLVSGAQSQGPRANERTT